MQTFSTLILASLAILLPTLPMDTDKTWAVVRQVLDEQGATIAPLVRRVDMDRLTA